MKTSTHFIVDLFEARGLDDMERAERSLRECASVANLRLLHIHLHPFEPNGGISGIVVMTKSHVSLHTWPEFRYAALDIFLCGATQGERFVEVLQTVFRPKRLKVDHVIRGPLRTSDVMQSPGIYSSSGRSSTQDRA